MGVEETAIVNLVVATIGGVQSAGELLAFWQKTKEGTIVGWKWLYDNNKLRGFIFPAITPGWFPNFQPADIATCDAAMLAKPQSDWPAGFRGDSDFWMILSNLGEGFADAPWVQCPALQFSTIYEQRIQPGVLDQALHVHELRGTHSVAGDLSDVMLALWGRPGVAFKDAASALMNSAEGVVAVASGLLRNSRSCLVGFLAAELRTDSGQTCRVITTAANMVAERPGGPLVPQTGNGQGSQTHLEIFVASRLGAFVRGLRAHGIALSMAEIAIVGVKQSSVVQHAVMCEACVAVATPVLALFQPEPWLSVALFHAGE